MVYGKIIDGTLEFLKMPLKIDGQDVFTTDDEIIQSEGYKPVIYTEPETRENFFVSGFKWVETDSEIIREWEYAEVDNNEHNNQ